MGMNLCSICHVNIAVSILIDYILPLSRRIYSFGNAIPDIIPEKSCSIVDLTEPERVRGRHRKRTIHLTMQLLPGGNSKILKLFSVSLVKRGSVQQLPLMMGPFG